jgi:hypothetical protein
VQPMNPPIKRRCLRVEDVLCAGWDDDVFPGCSALSLSPVQLDLHMHTTSTSLGIVKSLPPFATRARHCEPNESASLLRLPSPET